MDPERFLASFLLPLVRGGAVHVGAPLGADGHDAIVAHVRMSSEPEQIQRARGYVVAALLADLPPPDLDEESLRLAVAVHDLLFLYHPGAGNSHPRSDKLRDVARGASALATLPPSDEPRVLAARHSLLHFLPSLQRTDTRITFWAGRREFRGQAPPARLSSLPRLRRVHEERWTVSCFAEAAADPQGGADVISALLSSSPLTDLLHAVRVAPALDLSRMPQALIAAPVCRAVAYAWLEAGLDRIGAALSTAILELLDRRDVPASRFVLGFFAHLHVCVVAASQHEDADVLVARQAARGEPAQRDFLGLYPALRRVAPDLAQPADLDADGRLHEIAHFSSRGKGGSRAASAPLTVRLAAYSAACAATCGPARVDELAAAIARSIGTAVVSDASPAAGPTEAAIAAHPG